MPNTFKHIHSGEVVVLLAQDQNGDCILQTADGQEATIPSQKFFEAYEEHTEEPADYSDADPTDDPADGDTTADDDPADDDTTATDKPADDAA